MRQFVDVIDNFCASGSAHSWGALGRCILHYCYFSYFHITCVCLSQTNMSLWPHYQNCMPIRAQKKVPRAHYHLWKRIPRRTSRFLKLSVSDLLSCFIILHIIGIILHNFQFSVLITYIKIHFVRSTDTIILLRFLAELFQINSEKNIAARKCIFCEVYAFIRKVKKLFASN